MAQGFNYKNSLKNSSPSAAESYCENYRSIPPLAAAVMNQRRQIEVLPPVEPPTVEICLSPLLWSESFGMLVEG